MPWFIGRGLLVSACVTTLVVNGAAVVVVCQQATRSRELQVERIEADRLVRNERDAALVRANSEQCERLKAEHELAAERVGRSKDRSEARVYIEALLKSAVFLPVRSEPPVELIPAPVEPFPIPTREEKP
jgi:hypothetical protein